MADNITEVLGSGVLSFMLDNLRPFTNYSCHISASTVAGAGMFSDEVTAETDESGERGREVGRGVNERGVGGRGKGGGREQGRESALLSI